MAACVDGPMTDAARLLVGVVAVPTAGVVCL